MFQHLIPLAILSLLIIPVGIPGILLSLASSKPVEILLILLFPLIFVGLYTSICIGFARLGLKAIVPGRFPRKLDHPVYGRRRLYGMMWTAIYYFKPLYWLLLSTRSSKTLLMRGFGYRGSIDMVTYPDTWIRDLPLLDLSEGAYLANKATIGTNMCLSDGTILVDKVKVGKNSVIGHLCMLAPGVVVGDHSETGSGSVLGMGACIGNDVRVAPCAFLNHGVVLADGVRVGSSAHIGLRAKIKAKGLIIPPFAFIPDFAVVNSAEDLQNILQFGRVRTNEIAL